MYTAYVLTEKTRAAILQRFPPKFPDVIAHHVTHEFGVRSNARIEPAKVALVGYICDESLEALIVQVNGTILRPDSKIYHITLSLDRSKGRKPVDSNTVIARSTSTGWVYFTEYIDIQTTPQLLN